MKMTETEQARCRGRCGDCGDPPCYHEAVCGPDVEPCDECAEAHILELTSVKGDSNNAV